MPVLAALASRVGGRSISLTSPPRGVVIIAVTGNVIAWMLYGLAFQMFARSVWGEAPGSSLTYMSIWAASYIVGYLFLFVPAGLGVRELALVAMLQAFDVANDQRAWILSVSSRLWLTALEIIPGLILLAIRPGPRQDERSSGPTPRDVPADSR
jgi:hypothetical protein